MSDETRPRDQGTAGASALPEGDEAPPRGVHAASIVRWGLVALVAAAAAGTWLHWVHELTEREGHSEVAYRCPMHPNVVQDRPGECPICGMDLVRATSGHAAPAPAHATAPAEGRFYCPMHPQVASDDPNATCKLCGGMKLVPRRASAARPGGPVPGLATVDLGADRTQLIGMRTARAVKAKLAPELRTVGFVAANEASVAIVAPRYTGWVEELAVAQSGQRVQKGQVLATLYSPELLTAQQVYLNAIRWADPSASSAAAPAGQRLDADAKKRLQLLGVATEDVEELSKRGQPRSAMPVRSPVTGYVAKKSALPGLYVQPGTELFQIADLSTVWVVADVYEYDMSRVAVGQRARLVLAAYPGESFTGRVQFIYPAVNPESRTLQARMEFKNPGLKLRPGMYGDVLIEMPAEEGLVVPTDAVVDTGELQYVFLAREAGRFEPRVVRLGASGEGRVRVLEGVAEGDVVVTTANFLLDSESRLRAAIEGFGAPRDGREGHGGHERRDDAREPTRIAEPPR